MPTGYTHKIKDGQTFNEFVWSCARAFGALIEMRDSPSDELIPERFEPSTFYADAIKNKEVELANAEQRSDAEWEVLATAEYDEAVKQYQKSYQGNEDLEQKYKAMLSEAEAWEPPTEEHRGLKEFMVSQLGESIRFDCGHTLSQPVEKTGTELREQKLAHLRKSIDDYKEENRREIERVEGRNKWLADLRASVPPPSPETSHAATI